MKKIFQKFIVFTMLIAMLSNICVTPVFAAHTHKGVACGKQVTWYEKKDGTNHTKITAYEDICSCGEVIGTVDEVRKTEKHSFSGDTCTKCKYTKAHTHKGVMCGKQVTWYEKKDGTNHIKHTANENLCSCGAYLGLIDQTSKTEDHSFSGDTCTKCNYTRTHTHQGVMCGDHKVWYEQKNSTSHTKYTANENLCSCGANLGLIDQTSKTEDHSFSGDTCTKCNYTRTHTHQGVMCGNQVSWYDDIDSTTHTYYFGYEDLCSCGAVIGNTISYAVTSSHSFSRDVCTECGYTRSHVHEGVMCGDFETWYEFDDENWHIYVTAFENICSCGKNLGWIDENRTYEPHDFSGDTCVDCGYTRKHVHKGVMCGASSFWYEDVTKDTHTLVTANEDMCSCGQVLGWTDVRRTTESHSFDRDTCSDCGYTREHVHKGALCGAQVSWIDAFDENGHTKVTANENLCICGEFLGYIDEVRTTTSHNFRNDVCQDCGYQREHVHKGVACGQKVSWYQNADKNGHTYVTANESLCSCGEMLGYCDQVEVRQNHTFINGLCSGCGFNADSDHVHVANQTAMNTFTFYTYVDDYQHHKVTYTGDKLCSCGAVAESGDYLTYAEPHTTENGFCIYCEAEVHEHKASKKAETGLYYIYSDENQHMRVRITSGSYCKCGEFLPEDSESVTYVYEQHIFSDSKCIHCGYSNKSYGEVVIEQSIFGDFSEDVNAGGVAGQIIIGEIPGVGFVADVRDLLASETPLDVVVNLVGFIPLIGSAKYGDEVYTVIKHTDDVVGLLDNSDEIYRAAKAVMKNSDEAYAAGKFIEVSRVADNFDEGFDSYDAFKRVHGSAGAGYEWHHIVEQSQIGKSGFSSQMINNGGNIIILDAATHRKVSGYYKRIVPGTNMSFRDWIAHKGFTYEQQQKIGEYVLEIYGVKVK